MFEPSDNNAVPTAPLSASETLLGLRDQLEAEIFLTNKATLFQVLDTAGITRIIITFDGYGDSGQIEDVDVKAGDNAVAIPDSTIEILAAIWGQTETQCSIVSIATAVECLAYDVLERTHRGWTENHGAYGDIIFDIAAYDITLNYNERFSDAKNYMHSF